MKLLETFTRKPLEPLFLGLSEDEHHYCLVKKEAEKFTLYRQKKPYEAMLFIRQALACDVRKSMVLVRPVPHHYIWHKTLFLPKSLSQVQLHRQLLQVLNNEQPLPLEQLCFDYRKTAVADSEVNRIALYALNKNYADKMRLPLRTVLDCELYCHMRAVAYFKNVREGEPFPAFLFQGKSVRFEETGLRFNQTETAQCFDLLQQENTESGDSIAERQLYFLALGACLWNGTVSI